MAQFLPRSARWAAPVAVAALIAAGGVALRSSADAATGLAPQSAAQLLAAVQEAGRSPFTGTITQTSRLGLPSLPGRDTASLQSLVSGTHTARVWYASPDKTRLALVGDLAETDVIHNGRDLWIWTSSQNTAQHTTVPAGHDDEHASPVPEATALTPNEAAARALAAVDPTTSVTVNGTSRVAKRPVYELVLRPKDTGSLVGQVRLAIDSKTSTPLRVQVYAKGGTQPAFETTFTSIDFTSPDPDLFTFSPPPGAKVSQFDGDGKKPAAAAHPTATPGAKPSVVGTGWTAVMVLRTPIAGTTGTKTAGRTDASLATLLRATTPVSGAYGSGRLLRTKLVTVLLLDDGRTLIGAVTPAALEAAASSPAAALHPAK